jgi:hypothetical protein
VVGGGRCALAKFAKRLEGRLGCDNSLTLHRPGNARTLGYDNAHRVKGLKKDSLTFDHRHWKGDIHPYEFKSPNELLNDFFTDVDRMLKEEGVQ